MARTLALGAIIGFCAAVIAVSAMSTSAEAPAIVDAGRPTILMPPALQVREGVIREMAPGVTMPRALKAKTDGGE